MTMRSFSKVPGGGQPVRTLNLGSQEVLNALDIHQHSTCFVSPCTHFEQIVKHVGVFSLLNLQRTVEQSKL